VEIFCTGSAYIGVVSVNPADGKTTLNATLNPSDPSCKTWNNWKRGTVTVNLSGSYTDGGSRTSVTVTERRYIYSNGTTYRSTSKIDDFSEVFTGSITGFSGPWTGSVTAGRNISLQIVK
jgi:hypothetical protein